MPDNFFEKLLQDFGKAYSENRDAINTANEGSLETKNLYESFEKLVEIQKKTSKAFTANQKLSANEYSDLINAYDKFQKCGNDFLKIQEDSAAPIYQEGALAELAEGIKNALIPAKQYAEALKAKGPAANLKEIYADKTWISDLFAVDPNTEARKNEPLHPYKANELSPIGSNVTAYTETVNQIAKAYDQHLKLVTGSKNPYLALKVKQDIMQSVMADFYDEGEPVPLLSDDIVRDHRMAAAPLDISGMNEISEVTILNKSFFEGIMSRLFDRTAMRASLETTKADPNTVSAIMKAYKKFELSPENMGITPSQMDVLEKTSQVIVAFSNIQRKINEQLEDGTHKNDKKAGVEKALRKCGEINTKFLNAMKGKNIELPSQTDMEELIDGLMEYAAANPRFHESTLEENMMNSMVMGFWQVQLPELFPNLKQYCKSKEREFRLQDAAVDAFNLAYRTLAKEKNSKRLETEFSKGRGLCHEEILGDGKGRECFEKLYLLRLAKEKKFRAQEVKAAKEALEVIENDDELFNGAYRQGKPIFGKLSAFKGMYENADEKPDKQIIAQKLARTILLGAYFEKELDACIQYYKAEGDAAKDYKLGYNEKLFSTVAGSPIPDEDINNVKEFTDKFFEKPEIKTLLNKSPEEIKLSLSSNLGKTVEELMYNNSSKFMDNLEQMALNEIATVKKGPSKSNSDSYNAMTEQLSKFTKASHNLGGLTGRDYGDLFNTLKNYVETHDSKPYTEHGQKRFNSAATLLCDVGMKLKQLYPTQHELCSQIDQIFKTTMIRSKVFRDAVVNKAKNYAQKSLQDAAAVIDANLKKEKKDMITGKLPNEKAVERILNKYTEKQAARVGEQSFNVGSK